MNFGNIGVILGGPSEERDISLCTGHAIANALRTRGHSIIEIGEKEPVEEGIKNNNIDIAFIALHGRYGEDGTVQKFLEKIGIPYTGSDPFASYNALDKVVSKAIFVENNIPIPEYIVVDSKKDDILIPPLRAEAGLKNLKQKISYPVVVKPADSGSSIGLTIVRKFSELASAVNKAFGYSSKIIIERYIAGSEITVGILGNASLPVINIVPEKGHYSYQAKYTKGMTNYIVPAELPQDVYRKIQYTGLMAHNVLGCRDFSRVDMRLDNNMKPWVLEVNTIPGFTETSLLPKAAKSVGIEFNELCERILTFALERSKLVKQK